LNVEVSHDNVPSYCIFCPIDVGGIIMRFGGVNKAFTNSSVWRETQSIIKSGNAEILLLLILIMSCSASGFAKSMDTSTQVRASLELAPLRERSGPLERAVLTGL
jgi:hypothetical protein